MRSPFIKLPKEVELALFLIQAELKTRRFFNGLQKLGLEDCGYACHFSAPIADALGLDVHRDEDFARVEEILESHSEEIESGDDSLMDHVLAAYVDLVIERKKQVQTE